MVRVHEGPVQATDLLDLVLVRRLLGDGDEAVPERLVVLLVLECRHIEGRQQLVSALPARNDTQSSFGDSDLQ